MRPIYPAPPLSGSVRSASLQASSLSIVAIASVGVQSSMTIARAILEVCHWIVASALPIAFGSSLTSSQLGTPKQCGNNLGRCCYSVIVQVASSRFKLDPAAPFSACPEQQISFSFWPMSLRLSSLRRIKKGFELKPQFIDLVFELFSLTCHSTSRVKAVPSGHYRRDTSIICCVRHHPDTTAARRLKFTQAGVDLFPNWVAVVAVRQAVLSNP